MGGKRRRRRDSVIGINKERFFCVLYVEEAHEGGVLNKSAMGVVAHKSARWVANIPREWEEDETSLIFGFFNKKKGGRYNCVYIVYTSVHERAFWVAPAGCGTGGRTGQFLHRLSSRLDVFFFPRGLIFSSSRAVTLLCV